MPALEKARQLLTDVTPLNADCGALCGRACCRADESGENGMLLFPLEERYYENDSDFIVHSDGRIVCGGHCQRDNRPLACRMFPLIILKNGKVKMDVRAWPVCPLMESGKQGLSQAFVQKVAEAAQILMADETQAAFIQKLNHITKRYEALKKEWHYVD